MLEPYRRTKADKHWVFLRWHPYRQPYRGVPVVPFPKTLMRRGAAATLKILQQKQKHRRTLSPELVTGGKRGMNYAGRLVTVVLGGAAEKNLFSL